ncbi:MAG: DUF3192 domain-containing protein [Idiomarina sp.]|nr:DUF3192 domain-containing protein [Idiomarina sp.]
MKKGFLIAVIGFVLYAIIAGGIMHFYTANPETMTWREREIFNRKYIGRLEIGTPRDEVLRLLGPPDLSEARTTTDGRNILILFYRTQHVRSDGITTRDETTPLLFTNDKLISWGEPAYESEFGS